MKRYSIVQRKKAMGNMTWYGRIAEDGIIRYESLKTKRKSDATEWLNLMNASRFLPENIMAKIAPKDRMVGEAFTGFMLSISTSAEKRTEMAYRSRLRKWVEWCTINGIDTLRGFSVDRAGEFSKALVEGCAPKTAKEVLRCLRQFFSWCNDNYDMVDYDPLKGIKPPKLHDRAKEFWTPEEIDMILDHAPNKGFRLFWSLMAFAGLRFAEALSFGPDSLVKGQLRVVGKGSKEAFLPVSDRLRAEMARTRIVEGMFARQEYERPDTSNETLRRAVEAAGLKTDGCTNHKFRHSFASNLIRAGVGVKQVQELMRHNDPSLTLKVYSHLLQEDLTEAVNAKKEG